MSPDKAAELPGFLEMSPMIKRVNPDFVLAWKAFTLFPLTQQERFPAPAGTS